MKTLNEFLSESTHYVTTINGAIVGSVRRAHKGYKFIHNFSNTQGVKNTKQAAIDAIKDHHDSWMEHGRFIESSIVSQMPTALIVTPLLKMSQAKQHKPQDMHAKPTINHAADDAQKARDAAERKREAEKNRREAEQRHDLAQAHKDAK